MHVSIVELGAMESVRGSSDFIAPSIAPLFLESYQPYVMPRIEKPEPWPCVEMFTKTVPNVCMRRGSLSHTLNLST